MPQRVIHKSGKDLTRHLIDTHQLDVMSIRQHPELRYQQLELSKLLDALDHLLDLSRDDASGWRDDTPPPPGPPVSGFFPGPAKPFQAAIFL
jgi:hypothetical protein